MTHIFSTYQELEQCIAEELRYDDKHPSRFATQKDELFTQIHSSSGSRMSSTAAFGGLCKRWQSWLIRHITHVHLSSQGIQTTSRTSIRNWQKSIFGKSCANQQLSEFSDSQRGPGERVPQIDTTDHASLEAQDFYATYRNALRGETRDSPAEFIRTFDKPLPTLIKK